MIKLNPNDILGVIAKYRDDTRFLYVPDKYLIFKILVINGCNLPCFTYTHFLSYFQDSYLSYLELFYSFDRKFSTGFGTWIGTRLITHYWHISLDPQSCLAMSQRFLVMYLICWRWYSFFLYVQPSR